jgi:hypothetical protein
MGVKKLSFSGGEHSPIVICREFDANAQYRALPEPKPRVVGVGWVVECAEKRQIVPEKRFEVDLLSVSLAPRKVRLIRNHRPSTKLIFMCRDGNHSP